MNTLGIKSSNTPITMGLKQHRSPHTMGVKTHMVLRNQQPLNNVSHVSVQDHSNLGIYEPILSKSNQKNKKFYLEKK